MINKQFDLNKFYSQSAKMSDFLKGKGHNISRTTLLHGLSVMMGEKNWNTLQSKLVSSHAEPLIPQEKLLTASEVSSSISWDEENIVIFNDKFEQRYLISCIESLFNKTMVHKQYKLNNIHNYKLFEESSLLHSLSDAFQELNNPSFLIKHLRLTDFYNNDILKIHADYFESFNSFINGEIHSRNLIGDELFFKFSFYFDLNTFEKENIEKLLTAILFQHALSPNNTYSHDFFVRHPLVRVNCRGKRVKVSIFAFINMDYSEEMDGGFFKLPSFFENRAFMPEGYNSREFDPTIKINTLYYNPNRFTPDINMTSLNNRELCHKMFIKN